jgi:hypothetical protein
MYYGMEYFNLILNLLDCKYLILLCWLQASQRLLLWFYHHRIRDFLIYRKKSLLKRIYLFPFYHVRQILIYLPYPNTITDFILLL